jgi:hypothetical protein
MVKIPLDGQRSSVLHLDSHQVFGEGNRSRVGAASGEKSPRVSACDRAYLVRV